MSMLAIECYLSKISRQILENRDFDANQFDGPAKSLLEDMCNVVMHMKHAKKSSNENLVYSMVGILLTACEFDKSPFKL
jgi:hypothetical protein